MQHTGIDLFVVIVAKSGLFFIYSHIAIFLLRFQPHLMSQLMRFYKYQSLAGLIATTTTDATLIYTLTARLLAF